MLSSNFSYLGYQGEQFTQFALELCENKNRSALSVKEKWNNICVMRKWLMTFRLWKPIKVLIYNVEIYLTVGVMG